MKLAKYHREAFVRAVMVAMRCFVASKLVDGVDVPEELPL